MTGKRNTAKPDSQPKAGRRKVSVRPLAALKPVAATSTPAVKGAKFKPVATVSTPTIKPVAKAAPVNPAPTATKPKPMIKKPAKTPKVAKPAATKSVKPTLAAPRPAIPAPVSARPSLKIVPTINSIFKKENPMATAFETTQDTVKNTVAQISTSAEAALESSKAAMEQMTAKSKEAIETSMKSMDEMADLARGNVEAVIASARAATTGLEQVAAHVTESSRKSFEELTSAAKSAAAAKTPNELMQLQSDYAKAQFDTVVSDFSKMTEMMMKISGDIFEPMQNRMAIASDKLKTTLNTK